MTSTIKLPGGGAIVWTPTDSGKVVLTLSVPRAAAIVSVTIDAPTMGAVIFGAEMAVEAVETAADRQRVQCAGDALCTVPSACETPTACGVAG
ncbi:hypothetical protein P3G55_20765 [Leptospira sp. 96542]|nr:hypothetical protein [Leptospira sp. 96542]